MPRTWTLQEESVFLRARRPWHELYSPATRRLPLPGRAPSTSSLSLLLLPPPVDAAPLVFRLTDDALLLILLRLDPRYAARCAAVCRSWRPVAEAQQLWRAASLAVPAWRGAACGGAAGCAAHCDRYYGADWRLMYRLRPRLRTDGLYVSRNTYLRRGVVELAARAPVHLVSYFRLLAFTKEGGVLSRTSSAKPAAHRAMARPRAALRLPGVAAGELSVEGAAVRVSVLLVSGGGGGGRGGSGGGGATHAAATVSTVHAWLRLRSTRPGANNRLDVRSLVQVDDGCAGAQQPQEPPLDWDAAADEQCRGWHAAHGGVPAGCIAHSRGVGRFMFIPWDELDGHELNAEELDFFVVD